MIDAQNQNNNYTHRFSQIEQAKQEWESTADSLSSVVCLLNNHAQILRANRVIELWHLGQVRSIKGRSLHALFHPDCGDPACYLSRFLTQAWEQIGHDTPVSCEVWDQVLRRDLSVQLRPVFLSPERLSSCVGNLAVSIISDVTERKRIERAFQSREQEYHDLVDRVATAAAIVQQQRVVFVNQAFIALFGYPRNEVSGLNPLDLFCRRDREIVTTHLARIPPSLLDQRWNAVGVTRDAHELWLNVEQTTITWEGQPAILLTIQDHTTHKLREMRLEEEITVLKQQQFPFDPAAMSFHEAVEAFEKYLLASALRQYSGHQRKISEMLGIPPKTLYRKIRQYGLKNEKKRR